jgi:hypothetical protein
MPLVFLLFLYPFSKKGFVCERGFKIYPKNVV